MAILNEMEKEKENIGKELFINHEHVRVEKLKIGENEYIFKFRKLSWDESLRIQNDAVTMMPDGGMEIDLLETTYRMALAALVKAPFEITRENLESLDSDIGEWLEEKLQVKKSFRTKK